MDRPFLIRVLVPCWVGLECSYGDRWCYQADSIRGCVEHASRWSTSTENDGRITADDVQNLRGQLGPHDWRAGRAAVYLQWLEEDAELAQQVADAWNAVADSGCADYVKCWCDRCEPDPHRVR